MYESKTTDKREHYDWGADKNLDGMKLVTCKDSGWVKYASKQAKFQYLVYFYALFQTIFNIREKIFCKNVF